MKLNFVKLLTVQSLFFLFALQVQATVMPETLTQEQLTRLGHFNEARIQADNPVSASLFGTSVAIEGNRAVVGARDPGERGYAYVFEFDGSVWQQVAELVPGVTPNSRGTMGYSVAISGDTIVVGAPGVDNLVAGWGNVYVYRYNGVEWRYEANLTHNEFVYGEHFGYSLAIEGSTIVVGATDENYPYDSSGSVHIFEFVGTGWRRTAVFRPDDNNIYQLFGHSVAIDGKRILIGSSRDYGYAIQYGAVYVLEHDGLQWKKTARLTVSEEDLGSVGEFGSRVALNGDVALIGARTAGDIERGSGAAYIFRYQDGTWAQEARFKASDVMRGAFFGSCVALADDIAVVGAYEADSSIYGTGATYIFRRENLQWHEQDKLATDEGLFSGMEYGYSCFIQGDRLIVGAPYFAFEGAAFVYDLGTGE